jgi:hypothetical protein
MMAVCSGIHVVVRQGSAVVHRRCLSECRDWRRCFTNLVDETTVWPWAAGADPLHLLAIREAAGGFAGAVLATWSSRRITVTCGRIGTAAYM